MFPGVLPMDRDIQSYNTKKSRNCIFLCHSLLTGRLCSHYITRLLQMVTSCRPVYCISQPHCTVSIFHTLQLIRMLRVTVQIPKLVFNQEETKIKQFISDLDWGELLRLLNSLIQPETQITMNTAVYDVTQVAKSTGGKIEKNEMGGTCGARREA